MEPVAEGLWSIVRPLRFLGLETGTRMTVARLATGGLFVHSPVGLDPALRAAVDARGPVAVIVAPSRFHHLSVGEWRAIYPNALCCCCPGLEAKRPDIAWDRVLGDTPEPEWRADLDQVFFAARSLENEVVFFHRASRTIVLADAIFNFATHPSALTRLVGWLLGGSAPGATWLERLVIRDRAGARAQIDRMLAWNADRIVCAHGDVIATGGIGVLRRAYAWL
ncbi:MAG: DUF4336 domain-containing protein [Deltaproteobacteria bacterium]|nr:DUF4336 domain-containing protein [Deltaproteobacteria bacterium]